jgi:arylsulfatase A-like enzyme
MPSSEHPAARAPVAAVPAGGTAARPGGASAAVFLAHGAALLLFLGFLRFEKALVLKLRLGLAGWIAYFLPEVVFVVLFTGAWMLPALSPRRPLRLTAHAVFGLLLAVVYALALADHVFFLHTGTRLRLELASYAVANLRMLRGLLGWGANGILVSRIVLAVLLALFAVLIGRRRVAPPRRRTVALSMAAAAVLAALPVSGLPVAVASLERSALPEFFGGVWHSLSRAPGGDLDLVAPADLYQPPAVTGRSDDPPDLVLVILESTGASAVPPYDPAAGELAPALAALAGRSVLFEDVYATVTHTSKALIGILCGFFPRFEMPTTESHEDGLPLTCAPELLARQGYRTLFLQTAFGQFENRPGLVRNLGYRAAGFLETLDRGRGFAPTGYLGIDEFAMLEPAVEWAARGGPEPYFLTVLTITPHHPYQVPGTPLTGEWREQYDETIRFQDRFVGALLDGLRENGALDDAVVVVLGDHGEAFGDHGRLQHDAVPYEEVVRVPLLISGPEERVGPPRTVGGLRHQVDLLPTLLDLAGAEWRGVLPGRSLLASDGHPWVFSSCWYEDFCLAMREGDRKVIYHFGRRPTEIFDLAVDPEERNDLAPTLPAAEVQAAERKVLAFQLSIDAFWAEHPAPEGESLWWVEEQP